jgi:hypothetical protein
LIVVTSVFPRLLHCSLSNRKKPPLAGSSSFRCKTCVFGYHGCSDRIPSLVIGSAVRIRPSESWSTQSRYIIKSNANALRYLTRRRSTKSSVRRACADSKCVHALLERQCQCEASRIGCTSRLLCEGLIPRLVYAHPGAPI